MQKKNESKLLSAIIFLFFVFLIIGFDIPKGKLLVSAENGQKKYLCISN